MKFFSPGKKVYEQAVLRLIILHFLFVLNHGLFLNTTPKNREEYIETSVDDRIHQDSK